VQKASKAAKEVGNAATSKIRIDVLKISQGTLGYLDRTTDPHVRIYADHIEPHRGIPQGIQQPAREGLIGIPDERTVYGVWPHSCHRDNPTGEQEPQL